MNVFIKSYFFVTAAVVLHGAYKGWFCLSQTLEGGQLGLPSRAVAEEQAEDEDMGAGEDTVGLQQCWAQLWG